MSMTGRFNGSRRRHYCRLFRPPDRSATRYDSAATFAACLQWLSLKQTRLLCVLKLNVKDYFAQEELLY